MSLFLILFALVVLLSSSLAIYSSVQAFFLLTTILSFLSAGLSLVAIDSVSFSVRMLLLSPLVVHAVAFAVWAIRKAKFVIQGKKVKEMLDGQAVAAKHFDHFGPVRVNGVIHPAILHCGSVREGDLVQIKGIVNHYLIIEPVSKL